MDIFLSYRFTGEDPRELGEILKKIVKVLENSGHKVFCSFTLESFFQEQKWSADDIYNYCLKRQEECNTFLAFIKSPDKSVGMEKEFQKALDLDQKRILVIREQLDFFHFREKSHHILEYCTLENLCEKLKEI